MRSHKLYFVPTVDQVEEKTPNGCEGGRGHTRNIYDPTVEQAEEEKAPNGCEGGWGHIKVPLWEGKLFGQIRVGQIYQPWQATGLGVLLSRKVQAIMARRKSCS